ncbi:c-type cytochrome [Paraburkholderia denitrificans]|uniref:C-type cytochrome n=1 Tax=Paraburkholderia denitrificans TaxID=694025 RepID=A0ABW0J2P0_9BURK
MKNIRSTSLIFATLIAAGAASMPSIAAARTVRVCMFPGNPTAALDTSVAREVFRVAGIAATISEKGIKDGDDDGVSTHELVKSLAHDCDVVAGFPVSSNADQRGTSMLYSQPYLHSGYVSIAPHGAGAATPEHETIAATYSSPSQLIAVQQRYAHYDLENTSEQTVNAVATKRAQRAIVWYPAVVAYEHAHPHQRFDVTSVTSEYSGWTLVFALNSGDDDLRQRIDAALTKLRESGALARLTRDWALPDNMHAAAVSRPVHARPAAGGIRLAGYTVSSGSPFGGGFIKVADSTASAGVPSFDKEQVAHGQALYTSSCAKCHGDKLEGNVGPALSGPAFAPAEHSHITVSGIFQYMSNNMPADHPGQMKDADYADLMAFLLYQNGYDAGKGHLTADIANDSSAPLNAGPRK